MTSNALDTMASSSPSPPQQQDPNNKNEQDTILFGSTPFLVFGEFAHQIDAALIEGVRTLPLLPEGGEEQLLQMLRKAYLKNIDVAEAYAHRNLFTIQALAPTRRQNIVKAFLSNDALPRKVHVSTKEDRPNDESSYRYPTKDDIPTSQQVQDAQAETKQLRQQLRDARSRRNRLLLKLQRLSHVHESAKVAERALQDSTSTQNIHDSVASIVKQKSQLDQLNTRGTQLSRELDQTKQERPEDNDVIVPPPRKKLTLEEDYEQQRKLCNIELDPIGLKRLQDIFKNG